MTDKKPLKERGRPKGILRFFLRAPLLLYRLGIGRALGGRFVKLTHTGRVSGIKRETVLEVVKRDDVTGTIYVASGWGENSNWLLNVTRNPRVGVEYMGRSFNALARGLGQDEASDVLADYAVCYPKAFGMLTGNILGEKLPPTYESARAMAEYVPVVALAPSGSK
jgi:deazaflavin-dependent oxidoreductase (nitroreductase family)